MANFIIKGLQNFVARQRFLGIERCNEWAGLEAVRLQPSLLDVGCGAVLTVRQAKELFTLAGFETECAPSPFYPCRMV
jgi:hypothetical protein